MIKRITAGSDGIYFLSYSVRESDYSQDTYDTWKRIIMDASLTVRKAMP